MTWLTAKQIAPLLGWSDRHVRREADRLQWRTKQSEQPNPGNGKFDTLYALADIPAAAQLAYAQQLVNGPSTELVPAAGAQLAIGAAQADPSLRHLTDQQRVQALERKLSIDGLIAWIEGDRPPLQFANGRPVRNSNDFAEWIAPQFGMTASGIWKRYMNYKRHGLAGLADKVREDKGTSRFFKKYPEAEKYVLAKFREGLSVLYISDALTRDWSQMYNHGSKPPSYTTVRQYIDAIPPALRDAVKLSEQQHAQKYAPFVVTDFTKLRVNQIWVSDHRIHDIFFQNDVFDWRPRLCALRLWETCIEDMRSRTIVASVWSTTPSSRTISSALRMGISRFGLPELFYVDNGKDYRKIAKNALTGYESPEELDEHGRIPMAAEAMGLLARLGIKVKHCRPRHPQSKLIESFFSGQSKRFDMIFGAAYAGARPDRRPDLCHQALKAHKDFLDDKRASSPLPLASEGIALALYWTEQYNAAHRHSGHGMDRRTPYEVFNELLPVEQRRLVDVTQIEPLFWDRESRVVANCIVQIRNFKFEAADPTTAARMYTYNGCNVTVACDPNNLSEALAFDANDGKLIGRLVSQQMVERGIHSHEQIQTMERLRKKLVRATKDFWSATTQGVPTEIDFMRTRANLPAPIQPRPSRVLPMAVGHESAAPAPRYVDDVVGELEALEE